MSTSFLIAVYLLTALIIGIAIGWYLRPKILWCRKCGRALGCWACGDRPALLPKPDTTSHDSEPAGSIVFRESEGQRCPHE